MTIPAANVRTIGQVNPVVCSLANFLNITVVLCDCKQGRLSLRWYS